MTSPNPNPPSISNVCAAIKNLGYGTGQIVRLYGEEFEVASDPFPDAEGIAVHAKTTKAHGGVRVVRLPATVVQSVKGRTSSAA